MEKDPSTDKIQMALDNLKRKLQKERDDAETLTQHWTFRRVQTPSAEDSHRKKLESELAAARNQLAEHKQAAEQLRQQLEAERDSHRGLKNETGAEVRELEEELNAARGQLQEQKSAAENLIQQFAAERDESRARLSEVEVSTKALEEELAAARQQLSEQQQQAAEMIQQLTAERDESRAQYSDVESRIQVLGEELGGAQSRFREQLEAAINIIRNLEAERDEFCAQLREQEARAQKVEKELTEAQQQLQEQIHAAAAAERARAELTLVLLSSDLLAMNLRSSPETRDAVREIQLGSQKLLDFLRTSDFSAPDLAKPNPSEETPREPAGPFGAITPV